MDELGGEVLPGAALALQQHCGIQAGDLADLAEQAFHGRRLADDHRRPRFGGEAGAQVADLPIGAVELERLADRRLQRFQVVEGLGQVVEQAFAHGRHRVAYIGKARNQDGHQLRPLRAELAQQLEPVVLGQALIHQHQVEILGGEEPPRLRAVLGELHLRTLAHQPLDERPGVAVVVDDQELGQHLAVHPIHFPATPVAKLRIGRHRPVGWWQ